MSAKFFKTLEEFRKWLAKHHASETELWVGYYKKGTGKATLTWQQSVDAALCYGWIDGLKRTVDEARYMIRFTPRKATSAWSAINIARVGELTKMGLMREAGRKAFAARKDHKSVIYSYEQKNVELPIEYVEQFKARTKAWAFFQSQPAAYRKAANWWVASAKREETQVKRFEKLLACSENSARLPQFTRPKKR
ncbi:MAG: YdeI/OmpD-associated family protein [Acidobacteriota bacterium]